MSTVQYPPPKLVYSPVLNLPIIRIVFLLVAIGYAYPLQAAVISYWRFEVDNDPSATGLDSPNEIAGEPSVISSTGQIDTTANPGSLPNTIIPISGAANTASLDGNPLDVNATAAYSPTLNVTSMTVEFWARTEEQDAVILARTSSALPLDTIANGFRIYDPNDLKVQYVVTNGTSQSVITIDTNFQFDAGTFPRGDGITNWHHIAFSYDEATGIGTVYADGVSIGSNTTTAGNTLYWGDIAGGDQPIVHIGVRMDGYNFSKTTVDNGFLDEIRFSDNILAPDELLITAVPEPSTWIAGIALCLILSGHRFHSRRK